MPSPPCRNNYGLRPSRDEIVVRDLTALRRHHLTLRVDAGDRAEDNRTSASCEKLARRRGDVAGESAAVAT